MSSVRLYADPSVSTSGGYEVTHGTQVLAIDSSDTTPAYWKADVSQAQLAHDVTLLLDEG